MEVGSESESRSVVSYYLRPYRFLYSPWNPPGQNTGVGSFSLLQGIFPTQGQNPGLLHCRQILQQLSHQGNPRISRCKLLYIEWANNKVLLQSAGNYIQYSKINHTETKEERQYIYNSQFSVQRNLHNIVNQLHFNKSFPNVSGKNSYLKGKLYTWSSF